MEAEEDEEGSEAERDRDRETPWGAMVEVTCVEGDTPPPDGKCRPPGIQPITCTPVVSGSLWRLPASK